MKCLVWIIFSYRIKGVNVSDEWIIQALDYLKIQGPFPSNQCEYTEKLIPLFLITDIYECVGRKENRIINFEELPLYHGKYLSETDLVVVLQVDEIVNVAVSSDKRPGSNGNSRLLKLFLSDGYSSFIGIELEWVPELSPDIPPGIKLLIFANLCMIRRGALMLTRRNCKILGGEVITLNRIPSQNISHKTDQVPVVSNIQELEINHNIHQSVSIGSSHESLGNEMIKITENELKISSDHKEYQKDCIDLSTAPNEKDIVLTKPLLVEDTDSSAYIDEGIFENETVIDNGPKLVFIDDILAAFAKANRINMKEPTIPSIPTTFESGIVRCLAVALLNFKVINIVDSITNAQVKEYYVELQVDDGHCTYRAEVNSDICSDYLNLSPEAYDRNYNSSSKTKAEKREFRTETMLKFQSFNGIFDVLVYIPTELRMKQISSKKSDTLSSSQTGPTIKLISRIDNSNIPKLFHS